MGSYVFSRAGVMCVLKRLQRVFSIVKIRRNQRGYNYLTNSFPYYCFLKAKVFMRLFCNYLSALSVFFNLRERVIPFADCNSCPSVRWVCIYKINGYFWFLPLEQRLLCHCPQKAFGLAFFGVCMPFFWYNAEYHVGTLISDQRDRRSFGDKPCSHG